MERSECRDKKRVLISEDVIINGIIRAKALDICEDGMYINTQAEFVSGAALEISFRINEEPVNLKAVVLHYHHGIGMGVKFTDLTVEVQDLIGKYIAQAEGKSIKKTGKNILLVDDSAQSRAVYKHKLTIQGYNVIEAANGFEALKHLQELMPDLVILDLWMEGIDGFKILQLMQLNPKLKDIPVIVLSARSVPEDIQRAMALGASDFLPKMMTTPIKLAEKVTEVLSRIR